MLNGRNKGRRYIELGLWLAGGALLVFYGSARLWAENERVRGLELLRETTPLQVSTAPGGPDSRIGRDPPGNVESSAPSAETGTGVDQSLWSAKRAREYAEAMMRPGAPVGALLIPSIDVEVPVYFGASDLNLNRGAAHIEGTSPLGADGNAGIAAHRDGFFRELGALHVDDDVLLEVDGQTMRYRVVDILIVKPTDVHVLAPTPSPSITLVTCYPFYFAGNAPERYIVRAELAESDDDLVTASR